MKNEDHLPVIVILSLSAAGGRVEGSQSLPPPFTSMAGYHWVAEGRYLVVLGISTDGADSLAAEHF